MKEKISVVLKLGAVTVFFVCVLFIALPNFYFMYRSADVHWMNCSIADQDKNIGGKEVQKLVQGQYGIYFVYNNKLMYIDDLEGKVNELYKLQNNIKGILVKDGNVFLYDDIADEIYRMSSKGESKKIIDTYGDVYMEGKNIYILKDRQYIEKYNLYGRRIFRNRIEDAGVFNNLIFDEYILYTSYETTYIQKPKYYMFNINNIVYGYNKLRLLRYYLPPTEFYGYSEENILPYNSFAEEVDETVRKKTNIDGRNLDTYQLQSIELFISDAHKASEVSDGYIYFLGEQRVTYRDRDYKEKLKNSLLSMSDEEKREKIIYETSINTVFRIKQEDIKKDVYNSVIDYENIGKNLESEGINKEIVVKNNTVYLLAQDQLYDGVGNIYVYTIDTNTGLSKEVYKKKIFFPGQRDTDIFCTDEYLFIYEQSAENKEEKRIIRINHDGSNPTLVMDENGEVVMKPLEEE